MEGEEVAEVEEIPLVEIGVEIAGVD